MSTRLQLPELSVPNDSVPPSSKVSILSDHCPRAIHTGSTRKGNMNETFDIRAIPAGHERWTFVKGFVQTLSGVPQNAVQRNLTPADVRREGKRRGLSLGRPSKSATWIIVNCPSVVRADVAEWTRENTPEHRSECNFAGYARAHGMS